VGEEVGLYVLVGVVVGMLVGETVGLVGASDVGEAVVGAAVGLVGDAVLSGSYVVGERVGDPVLWDKAPEVRKQTINSATGVACFQKWARL